MPELNETLSEREQEILRLVATGAANKEIAHQLVISPNTVKVHVRNIFAKIGVSSRTEATLYAIKIGLVQTTEGLSLPAGAEEALPEDASTNGGHDFAASQPGMVVENNGQPQLAQPSRRTWLIFAVAALLVLAALVIVGTRLFRPISPLPTVVSQVAPTPLVAQRWSERPPLPSPRKGMGAAEYGGAFYIIGGETSTGIDGALLRFDPSANTWQPRAEKPTPVTDVQAALIGEKIYVPGGRTPGGEPTNRLEVYDPRADSWETRASLPAPVSAYALAPFEGKLYLFGGKNGETYLSTVYEYNPETDRWSERAPLTSPRAFAGAAVFSGRIHLLGGYDGENALATNEAYFPARDGGDSPTGGENPAGGSPTTGTGTATDDAIEQSAWESFSPLPDGRYAMGVTNLAGMVFLLGGEGEQAGELPALQYQPEADSWAMFDRPPTAIHSQLALVAYGNFLYAIGGVSEEGLSAAAQSYQAIYTISVPLLQND